MTPFRALYLKEYREHHVSLMITYAILFLMNLFPFCLTGHPDPFWMGLGFYLFGFYLTAIAAMSYAKEDEAKTSQFLRRLPVRSSTIFRAKFAWLLTSAAALSTPLLFWGGLYLRLRVSEGVSVDLFSETAFFSGVPVLICLLVWAYFWTTRWPNKVYAVLMTFVSAYIFLLFVALIILAIANIFYGGRMQDFNPVLAFGFLISPLPVAWFAFRKILTYYDGFEREKKTPVLISMPGQTLEKPKPRLVTRLFSSQNWTPFQGLLWQSVCQTKDALLLCLVPGSLTFFWFYFFPRFWGNYDIPVRTWTIGLSQGTQHFIEGFGIITTMATVLVLFAVASTVFSQDRANDRFRFLGYRGVSLWKFWLSRMLPYVFLVSIICFCAIFLISREITSESLESIPMKNLCLGLGMILTLVSAPLCFGSFFSMLSRSLLLSIVLTGLCSALFYLSLIFFRQLHPFLYLLCPVVLLGFLAASYSLAASRLYERPLSKSWQAPTLAVAIAVICGAIPPLAFFWNEYLI